MTNNIKMNVIILSHVLVFIQTIQAVKVREIYLGYNYTCPTLWKQPCKCATLDYFNTDDIQVHCEIFNIAPNYPDFSLIQGSHTNLVFLICEGLFLSELYDGMFQHLNEMEELAFANCGIKIIFPGAFKGLDQLRILNSSFVLPYIPGFPKRNLIIEPNSFSNTLKLEMLNLPYLGISKLPKGLFCGLQHMKYMNLAGNELKSEVEVGYIDDNFNGICMPNLTTLGLSNNQLKLLSVPLKHYTPALEYLYIGHNMVTSISSDVLANMTNLLLLQIANNKLTEIPDGMFKGLINLEQVYMDSNEIQCLSLDLFNDNAKLTVLYMDHNKLSTNCLPKINHLNELQILDLGYNQIKHLPNDYFKTFSKLKVLHLEGNGLAFIERSMFYSFVSLQNLNLSHNALTSFIFDQNYAGVPLEYLGILDISFNQLSNASLEIANFTLIPHLQQLKLHENQLSQIPNLKDIKLTKLILLNLESNEITEIMSKDFLSFPQLKYLSFKNNNITYVPRRAFAASPELYLINLSWNNIETLEYQAFKGSSNLKIINLSHNQISEIDQLIFVNNLQILLLSHNLIRRVQGDDLPASLVLVDMSFNQITEVEQGLLLKFLSLTHLDLTFNSLKKIEPGVLERNMQTFNRPNILLSGNPIFCDCTMYYMQAINTLSKTRFALVGDLNYVLCNSLTPGKHIKFLTDLNPEDFLCSYCPSSRTGCELAKNLYFCPTECPCKHTPLTCHCCQFCPDKCVCFTSGDHNYNRIDCMNKGLTKVPGNRLPYASHVFLDGNNISSLVENDFGYASTMKVLYLNDSEIRDISQFIFQKLSNLESLYLNDNLLIELKNQTFIGLTNLEQLFLHNNSIFEIEIHVFQALTSLKELHLENNNLSTIDMNILDDLNHIRSYFLADNPWHCDCNFGPKFQTWITKNSQIIKDMPVCETLGSLVQTNSSTDYRVTWIDFAPCKNLMTERIIHKFDKAHLPIIISIIIVFILFIIGLLLIYRYRDLLQVWLYTNYGIRYHKVKEDEDKDYDIFISYSSSDQSYVVHELMPMLEEGNPPYKACVHYRDWIVGNGIADSIISSVHSSRRTLLLLSNSFVQSEWCNYEFQTAHHQVLKDKTCRLIVVLMEDEPPEDLDDELQLYIQSHTYIRRSDPWFYKRLKYALPEVTEGEKLERWEAKRREKKMLKKTRDAMMRLNII